MENITFDCLPLLVTKLLEKADRIEMLLTEKKEPAKPQWLGFSNALDYLDNSGLKLSDSKLQKLTASGQIPCSKFNNRLVFDTQELDSWVESQMVKVADKSGVTLALAKSANRKLRGN